MSDEQTPDKKPDSSQSDALARFTLTRFSGWTVFLLMVLTIGVVAWIVRCSC